MTVIWASIELWALGACCIMFVISLSYWTRNSELRSSLSRYKYRSLEVDKNEIRLLALLPGSEHEIVRCKLRHASLSDRPSYAALSYFWGDHSDMVVIEVDGIRTKVTRNLEQCLRQMRPRWNSIELWVDALCIDQGSMSERATQVLRMFSIYQEARVVVIWLGLAAEGSDRVMSTLAADQGNDQQFDLGAHFSMSTFQILQPASAGDLQAFLSRPYWHRTWIIQEVAAAREICILCGERTIELRHTSSLLKTLTSTSTNSKDTSVVTRLLDVRDERRNQKPPCLLDLLHRTSDSGSTEVLDKVFGLLGIARNRATFVTEPNYRQTPRQLCQTMTWNWIQDTGFLDIIFLASYQDHEHLPSWSPNFMAAGAWVPGLVKYVSGDDYRKRLNVMANRWNTTGKTRAGITNTSIDQSKGIMRVKGMHVHSVDSISLFIEDQLWRGLRKVYSGQVFCGWADPCVCPSDQAFILYGCTIPVILRPLQKQPGRYRYIGRVYLPKALGGDLVDALISDAQWLELH